MNRSATRKDAVAELCPACGLCCNGVLFADVELAAKDDRGALKSLGLELRRKGRKQAFAQPCACFHARLCRIYADRPERCRTFECGVLKRVQGGKLKSPAALKLIAQVQRQARVIEGQLERLGNRDTQAPLSRRYAKVMAEPIDLSGDADAVELRAELMLGVAALMELLHHHFLN